jgi:hypothetical protein
LRQLDLEIGPGVGAASETPALVNLIRREAGQIVVSRWKVAVQDTNPAAVALALSAAREFYPVFEEHLMERGAGTDLDADTEREEFDVKLARGFHGACWWA